MIREDLGGVYLSVISCGRSGNVARQTEMTGPATWFVAPGDEPAYQAEVSRVGGAVLLGGLLCEARNRALEEAFGLGLTCVQLSDDLRRVRRAVDRKATEEVSFGWALAEVRRSMLETRARLGGVAPTTNAFYFNPAKPLTHRGFILGDWSVVDPCDLRWDEGLRLKEDYDFTLQHLRTFGVVARRNDILADFAHRSNAGGAVAFRTAEREQEAIRHLKAKWGQLIRDNPRRPNEILLRLGKE